MRAWLSLMGLYDHDDTLFDDLVLPASIDKEYFITELLMQTAELEAVYTSVPAMKMSIGVWSRTRLHTWERIEEVLYEKYDPFVNIKRDETRTIETTGSGTSGNTQTNTVSAWNESTFQNREQITDSGSTSGTSLVTEHFHVEGDSAITDAQDVAKKEVELRTQYDLYQYIINDFKNRYCLLVY